MVLFLIIYLFCLQEFEVCFKQFRITSLVTLFNQFPSLFEPQQRNLTFLTSKVVLLCLKRRILSVLLYRIQIGRSPDSFYGNCDFIFFIQLRRYDNIHSGHIYVDL
jgi:hypothetical protein